MQAETQDPDKVACTEVGLPSSDRAQEDLMEPGLGLIATVNAGNPNASLDTHAPAVAVTPAVEQLHELSADDLLGERQPGSLSDANISPTELQFAGAASVWEPASFSGDGADKAVSLKPDRKWGHINPGEDDTSDLNLVEKGMCSDTAKISHPEGGKVARDTSTMFKQTSVFQLKPQSTI